jgi:hypothetical protein
MVNFHLIDLCTHGTDQRDYLYFLAEANYKLSVIHILLFEKSLKYLLGSCTYFNANNNNFGVL